MKIKQTVLFVCVHNSARSQMAEAFLNRYAGDRFEAESAGIEPGELNPIVVDAMKDIGIDISANKTKSVKSFIDMGKQYDYVIAVCDEASAKRCPVFPGLTKRFHMDFSDPSKIKGSYKERLQKTIEIRDEIVQAILAWSKNV